MTRQVYCFDFETESPCDLKACGAWVYSQHPEKPFFEAEPEPGVHILTGVGGSGMTLSFGLAERTAENIL